jgi:osmoprotectant transport system permease protein
VTFLRQAFDWMNDPINWRGGDGIPARLLEHLGYSLLALLLAALVAFPLGLLIGHTRRGAFIAINASNAARSLPTLGVVILAFFAFGLGLTPAMVALVVLAIPSILVNTYAGLVAVDADLIDAAQGMGMTETQVLTRVEIPVAMPLILLGFRTAAIQIVSTATIAAVISLGGLGRYIIDGLPRRDYPMVAAGAFLVAVLAVVAELLFVVLQRGLVSPGIHQKVTAL